MEGLSLAPQESATITVHFFVSFLIALRYNFYTTIQPFEAYNSMVFIII